MMPNIHLNKIKRSTIKSIFKQYKLAPILWGLWQLKDNLTSIEIAYTTTIAIEFSEPGGYENKITHLDKRSLLKIINLATNFCLNNSESKNSFNSDTNDIFYTVFNLMANQLSISASYYADYARSLVLYEIIPNEIESLDPKYSLSKEFIIDKGYTVNEYLQVCFLANASINSSGKFDDNYLEIAVATTKFPNFETMNSILSEISASAIHYRRERKRLNSRDSFKYQPLQRYPLIKPWSHIPKHTKGKRYLAPLPNLIAHKANIGIYHHFLSKYKIDFTIFFGKEIFERYVKKTLKHCSHDYDLKDENVLKNDYKFPQGVNIPDFCLIKGDKGIIIECKAAVLPLSVYTRGDMNDFRTTVNKIHRGVLQTTNFEEYALKNSFYNVKKWIRVIVTYEPLWGINSTILSDILISDFKNEKEAIKFKTGFEQVLVLSISQLDTIQTYTSKTNSLYSILRKMKSNDFNEVINNLVDETGKTFVDSHLSKYMDKLINNLVP